MEDTIEVLVDVRNTGKMMGKEVVQVYVSKPNSKVNRAQQELKGFSKVEIEKSNTLRVKIEIPVEDLSFYNIETKSWEVENGEYKIKVGNSSRNIVLENTISVE